MPPTYVYELSGAQNNRCCYCHHEMNIRPKPSTGRVPPNSLTKDHFIPRCYGGPTTKDNLVAACGQCNWIRGSLDADTFYEIIRYWFQKEPGLWDRWHTITREEFSTFKKECDRIDKIKWGRQIKKCAGAVAIHKLVPLPLPPHQIRA